MSESLAGAVRCCAQDLNQAISIHTRKITDSCRDKDCIEDLRVYLTRGSQTLLDTAASVRVRSAELLYTYVDVEPVAFDSKHYCIDSTYYYRVLADATIGGVRPATLYGLAVFTKRAVLCGEESRAHIYYSDVRPGESEGLTKTISNLPTAVVEVLDPMVLSSRVREACEVGPGEEIALQVPKAVCAMFDDELVMAGERRRLYVTLGQFSIVYLERDAQLISPVLSYAVPTKQCCENPGCTEDPCEIFSKIPFPTTQFNPNSCDGQCSCGCQNGPEYRTAGTK